MPQVSSDGLPFLTEAAPHVVERTRKNVLERLAVGFDMIVIGGGINGSGIAWEAALRGLDVLLLEKSDYGSGTSSWSSRMIHGGLKYLEVADIGLVRESLREREWLLNAAPHLVKPLRFVLPFYSTNVHSQSALRLGMLAYDVLSFNKSVGHHSVFSRKALLKRYDGLNPIGLTGGATYFDAQVEFAGRLVLEVTKSARSGGALTLNYAQVDELIVKDSNHRVTGVRFVDRLTGDRHEATAKVVINVTGPWVDELLTTSGPTLTKERLIGGTKGSHFIVDPFPGAPHDAMYYEAVADGRPLMVIPWLGRFLIGSTDHRTDGDLDTIRSGSVELDYVLRETNRLFPLANLTATSVLYSYCGVRPLPYDADKPEGQVTRRHILHRHGPGLTGLYSVIGGKLTTFRALAEEFVDEILRENFAIKPRKRTSPTRRARLPGAGVDLPGLAARLQRTTALSESVIARLIQIYGATARDVAQLAASQPSLAEVIDESTCTIAAQVVHAVRCEQAVTMTDLLARRTMIGLEPDLGLGAMAAVGRTLINHCGWSEARVAVDSAGYLRYLERLRA